MSNSNQPPPSDSGPGNTAGQGPDDGPVSQQFTHTPVTARVPDRISRGVLSTGIVVLDSPNEFVIDFLQGLSRPHQIVARVVLAPNVMAQFLGAAQNNLQNYTQQFGPPPPLPKPPPNYRPPTIQEIYENFKLPEELTSGAYANSVLIGHSAAEFFFDFITGFYPTSAVNARVFITAPQMPRLVDTLTNALAQFRKRFNPEQRPPQAG